MGRRLARVLFRLAGRLDERFNAYVDLAEPVSYVAEPNATPTILGQSVHESIG